MRIYYPNLIDSYSAISGTSQASAALGYANVAHEHISRVWRTGTSVADEYVTIDLGSAQAATAAIIFEHTLTAGDSAIQLRKSTDNFAADDVLVGTFVFSAAAMVLTFSSASSRYWRVKFTKSAAGVSRDIARIFIGNYADIPLDGDGFGAEPKSLSNTDRSEGGQTFSTIRDQYRAFKFSTNGLSQSEVALLKTFTETVDTHTPFFVIADTTPPSDESGETLYCKLTKMPPRNARGFDSSGNIAWQGDFTAEEQL